MQADTAEQAAVAGRNWYACSPSEITADLHVDPALGLSAQRAAALLSANGPNALPEEKPRPGWLRFLAEYRSYMQIILFAAAVVSLLIKEWSTAVLLVLLTVLNAVVGMRQEGKAESAMNALKSMMKATARVRRDGVEAQIAAEDLVVGDVVLISAGDQVPADGRIIEASVLQIDESALTGESVPAAKNTESLSGDQLGPGDQVNMAFMNTPVTHGSGVVIVTATGAGTELGKISGMLAAAPLECRSETGTVLTTASFDSKQINWAMLGEFFLAVAITQMDLFNRLLGTVQINLREWAWALVPALALLLLWELGKLIARRSAAPSNGSPPAIETTR